jgi:hypothetical protein
MIAGFTGSQKGATRAQLEALRDVLADVSFLHHGDCIGADALAHGVALSLGVRVVLHPCNIEEKRAHCEGAVRAYPPRDPLVRNRHIVNATDVLIALPASFREALRSGTWATIRYARPIRKVVIIWPDGTLHVSDQREVQKHTG